MTDVRWETLQEATAIVEDATLGFESAEDELAFGQLAGGLLEALAVQIAVRRFMITKQSRAQLSTALNEAAHAFEVRARWADTTHSCNCYHDDVHDFTGCRNQDLESEEFCDCRAISGRVEELGAVTIAERVRDQYQALSDEAVAAYEQEARAIEEELGRSGLD